MSTGLGRREAGIDTPAAALWMSAFVLFGLIVVQASRLGAGSEALAGESASRVGDLSAVTASDGDQQDILLILDGREEKLFVYTVRGGGQQVETPTVVDLRTAFNNARGTPVQDGDSRRGR